MAANDPYNMRDPEPGDSFEIEVQNKSDQRKIDRFFGDTRLTASAVVREDDLKMVARFEVRAVEDEEDD